MIAGTYEAALRSHYAEVRSRLSPTPPPKVLRVVPVPIAPAPEPVAERTSEPAWKPIRILAIDGFEQADDEPIGQVDPFYWRKVIKEVAQKRGLTVIDILSERRDYKTVHARHEVFYRLRTETPMSLPRIGRRIGGVDHTTVLAGIKKHMERAALERSMVKDQLTPGGEDCSA